jgi:Tir chaperone protein (CesT) family
MDRNDQIKMVDSWMKDLSGALGINLRLNQEGICTFQIGQDVIAIEVSQDFPMVYLYSSLLSLPLENKEQTLFLLARALELNAFQILTRGGSIASAPGGGVLIYCYSVSIEETDSEKFSKILGAFFETLSELKKLLSQTS